MRLTKRSILITVIITVFMATSLVGNALAKDKEAELAYVEWACATASAYVVKEVLETKMDYDITLTPVSAAAMWQALAAGDVDFITTAWVPTTHGHYLERVGDQVEDLGHNLVGTRIGLVVPTYVTIGSIAEMNDHAAKFDNQITGIDPGAGIMSKTEEAIEVYGLDKMNLMEASDAMMTAVLKDKVANNQWVVVTGWTPHWKFGAWDLKYLDDPEGVYGGEEFINTVVRLGLKEDKPDLYKFLNNFEWSADDIQTVMAWSEESSPEASAKRWVEENQDKVASWLP